MTLTEDIKIKWHYITLIEITAPPTKRLIPLKRRLENLIEYRSDDVTNFLLFYFFISAFWIPCLGGA